MNSLAEALAGHGLNRLAVFDLAPLPEHIRATLPLAPDSCFRQLLLVGHGGRRLWQALQDEQRAPSPDPIDDFTIDTICQAFAAHLPGQRFRILYPGDGPLSLIALGQQAGWHHASPMRIGIDPVWGSWFAYRAVLLADTDLPTVRFMASSPPCAACPQRPCITACPAGALSGGDLDPVRCAAWRLHADSPCAQTCLARLACPVGAEHRYEPAQIEHSYGRSLAMLQRWMMGRPEN